MNDPEESGASPWAAPDGSPRGGDAGADTPTQAPPPDTAPAGEVPAAALPPYRPTEQYRPTEVFPQGGFPPPPGTYPAPQFHGTYPPAQGPGASVPAPGPGTYPMPWGPTPGYPPGGGHPMYGAGGPEVLQAGAPARRPGRRGRVIGLVIGILAVLLVATAGVVFLGRSSPDGQGAAAPGPSASVPPSAPGGAGPTTGNPVAPVPSNAPTVPTQGWTVPINAYCRQVDLQLKAVPSPQSSADQVSTLRGTATIIRAMNSRLQGMQVPQTNRSDYNDMLAAWDQVPVAYDQAAAAAAGGDQNGVDSALNRSDQANNTGNALANKLGLGDCADAGGLPNASTTPTQPVI